ncbi:uncharacterized protein [Nicotiana tomentosiformis]|uniref:uncharacterized protein n=1 Tax=Nicotiana tomentosiformis TaxID=4098 RepID=UPI00388CE5DD
MEVEDPMRSLLLLWNDLIPVCPEVFMPYIDFLIEGFKDFMPTVSQDHRCGVAAAKASVKLVLYLGNTANYSKFYDLMGYVMMTLFMALGEEVLVCSLLEDLIILAGAETEFFTVQIDVIIASMVKVVENLELKERTWQLAIEFVLIVAEDVASKLLSQLIVMLVHIEDDPNWGNAISDDENAGELSMCSYAMESLGRLAIALGGNVILPSCLEYLFSFLYDENWRIRHAGVTAIGLISEGCSKALLQEMGQLVETVVMLIHDTHPRVHWATIHAIGQLSKYLSPHFQEQYHQQILPALREVLDDFDNPRLQRGMTMMKEAALATLASLAISSQEDAACIYDSIMPYLKVILLTATKDTSRMHLTKSLECLTMIAMAVGNLAILDYVEKVTSALISLQETHMEVEDPMRSLLLQARGRLCKCFGTDFLPYLSVSMLVVLKSAQLKNYLSVSNNSDTEDSDDESMIKVTSGNKKIGIRSALLEGKALACHILCCFAAELKEGQHLWVNEVVSGLVPNLTFKFSQEVRMGAISVMALLLHSADFAVRKGLPVTGCGKPPVQKLFDSIIPALLDALQKESKVQIQARLLDAFNESIQLVATAVGICAKFGGDILKPHTIGLT